MGRVWRLIVLQALGSSGPRPGRVWDAAFGCLRYWLPEGCEQVVIVPHQVRLAHSRHCLQLRYPRRARAHVHPLAAYADRTARNENNATPV